MANVKQIKINDTVYDVEDSVARSALEQKAPLESPALTGIPTAPTASNGTSTTQIATTAFVQNAVQGAGGSYTLPVASSTTLGGVKPVAKTASMTQEVGVDASGALYTEPGSGGGGSTDISLGITGAAVGEVPKVSAVNENGAPTAWETVAGEEVTLGPVPLTAPATAAVGQIIKVKTVDESGKVTGTEAVDMPQGGGADISLGVTGATVGQLVKISEVDADGKPTVWEAFDPAKWTKIGDTINITDAGLPVYIAFPDAYSELMVIGQKFVAESKKSVYAAITPLASNYSMQRIVNFDIGAHPYGTDFRIMAHNYTETETTIKIVAEAYTSQSGAGFGSASATTKLKSMQKTSVAAGTNGYISIFTENEIAITSGNIEVYAR